MAKKTSVSSIGVVLKLPTKVADLIVRAQVIHDAMAANSKTLPSPSPAMPVLQTGIDDLAGKEAATKTRTAGAVADRDAAKQVLVVDLNSERLYVEAVVNADPANASQIAEDAGMYLRQSGSRSKPLLSAKPGATTGTVKVIAKATKGAKANDWQYSTDGGKTWIDVPSTTKAETTVPNLTPGAAVSFRQRALTKTGAGDWSQPVVHIVT